MNHNSTRPPPLPKKSRKGFFLFLAVGVVTILVGVIYLARALSGAGEWQKYKKQLQAKGESIDFTNFIPRPVPDDRNFALSPIVATSYSYLLDSNGQLVIPQKEDFPDPLGMDIYADTRILELPINNLDGWTAGKKADLKAQELYYEALATKTNLFPISAKSKNPAEAILLALSRYDSTIKELRLAGQRPESRFPLNYNSDNPFNILLPHLARFKHTMRVLELRALAELANNQSGMALADIKLSFRMIESVRNEPILISHLVRIASTEIIFQPIWEGLNDHKFSEGQLIELENELAKLNFLDDFEFSMRGERAMNIAVVDYLRRTRKMENFFNPVGDDSSDPSSEEKSQATRNVFYRMIPSVVFYKNEINLGNAFEDWVFPVVDSKNGIVLPDFVEQADEAIRSMGGNFPLYTLFARTLLPPLPGSSRKFAHAQNAINMARIACALERYRIVHNDYPDKLDILSPQFIPQVPHDVIGGDPLEYHRVDGDHYVLYSIGWNQEDDGGQIGYARGGRRLDLSEGDWLWNGEKADQPNNGNPP